MAKRAQTKRKKTDGGYSQFRAEQESDSANSSPSPDTSELEDLEEEAEVRKRGPYKKVTDPEVLNARVARKRENDRLSKAKRRRAMREKLSKGAKLTGKESDRRFMSAADWALLEANRKVFALDAKGNGGLA